MIHDLYQPDWPRLAGTTRAASATAADDPRIALVLIEAHSVIYSKKDRPCHQLFAGEGHRHRHAAKMTDVRSLDESELRQRREARRAAVERLRSGSAGRGPASRARRGPRSRRPGAAQFQRFHAPCQTGIFPLPPFLPRS
jgi:hypothetical protein